MKKVNEKRVEVLIMVWLVFGSGIIIVPARASFKSCYESCFLICLITPNHSSAFSCSFKCLKDCILQPPNFYSLTHHTSTNNTANHRNNIIYFCKLGCASSLCTNFSSKNNPSSEKVESCVDSCSDTCTMN